MIEERTWEEFRSSGLFWWVNRMLHLLGWSIVIELDADDVITKVFPARCKFRGFTEEIEAEGFVRLTGYMKNEAHILLQEAQDERGGS